MSRQTTNYGLTKPDYTDTADIEVVNANMDIIDGALKVIDTKSNNVMSKNSSAWSSTVTYAVGQYCIYNNSLWKCLVQHSGQTPQEGTYWARVSLDTLGSEINALNNNMLDTGTYGVVVNFTSQKYNGYVRAPINFKIKSNKYTIKLISALRLGDTYQYAEDIEIESRYGCAVLLSTKEELIGACVLATLSIS